MNYLETERLILRDWREQDLEPFAAMNADNAVMEFFPAVFSREESYAIAMRLQQDIDEIGYGFFAVALKATGNFIGSVGLSAVTFDAAFVPAVEIAWRLAAASWGQGFASEAARACLSHGFSGLGLSEIVSFTTPQNTKSMAVMERIGMSRDLEGDFEHPNLPVGHHLRAHVLYRIKNPRSSQTAK
ncbi:MAG: GNAT family N-acetyltransferase [Alphaproteobacteria bacterium]|nr:GNAT family N-acetyltransferase [Alphaproteobacteria bacterium]